MNTWSVDNLISFDEDDAADQKKDSHSEPDSSRGNQRISDTNTPSACFSNVQYFSNPHHIPTYHPDDFIRESINQAKELKGKEDEELEKNVKNDYELMNSLKETQNFNDIKTPPLPPKRFKNRTSDNSLLWQRLRDAGIIVAHSPKNPFYQDIDPDKVVKVVSRSEEPVNDDPNSIVDSLQDSNSFNNTVNNTKTQNTAYPFTSSSSGKLLPHQEIHANNIFKSKLQKILSENNDIDLFAQNLNEFDTMGLNNKKDNEKISRLKSNNPFLNLPGVSDIHKSKSLNDIADRPNDYNAQLKSLTLEDLETLERDGDSRNVRFPDEHLSESLSDTKVKLSASINKNRFSCPPAVFTEQNILNKKNDKIFFSGGLFQKSEERNEEVLAFFRYINEMRKLYQHNDIINNPGFITPAIVSNNALLDHEMDIYIFYKPCTVPKILTCNLALTSNNILLNALQLFKGEDFLDIEMLSNQYIFRIVGEITYLDLHVRLCDYVFVQDCVKHNKNIELMLTLQCKINRDLARDLRDDLHEAEINLEHYFEVPTSLSVSEQGLSMLLDTYNKEVEQLIADVTRPELAQYAPDRLIQVVKAITMALATIELLQIHDAINILLSLKGTPSLYRTYTNTTRERRDYNEYISPLRFDQGRFNMALEKLTGGVYALIELYCQAFHSSFKLQEVPATTSSLIDVYERIDPRTISDKFIVRVASVHRIPASWKFMYEQFDIEASLYYGGHLVCPVKRTEKVKTILGLFEHIRISELIEFDVEVKKIPRETKIAFSLYGNCTPKKGSDGRNVLGWFTTNVYDYEGFLLNGSKLYGLVANTEFNPVATCATNYIQHHETVILKVDFQLYHTEVLFPQPVFIDTSADSHPNLNCTDHAHHLPPKELNFIEKLFTKPPYLLTKSEKHLFWKCRFGLSNYQHALIYVLASVPSWDSENISKVHSILNQWVKLTAHAALEFLQADYPDKIVREVAVSWLADISDDELCDYLPDLVQALKYEPYHNSSLARFLIARALKCPRIALFLFWFLKYYIGDIQFCQRFQIVLSGFLSICGGKFHKELSSEDRLMLALSNVAKNVKQSKESIKRYVLQTELEKINEKLFLDSAIRLPIKPGFKACQILAEESSYFSSNAVPLKITMQNSDPFGKPVHFIYKIGDDLRKDLITILLFRTMNKLWMKEGLDLKMMLYNVLPTGPMTGLIEIIPNSATFREIHVQHGLTGSFKDDSIALWLQRFNSTEEEYQIAINNFTASAAGYCVATYLLGIGDRHNDNIMLTKNGHLFHIDFNKFMGDVQKFGNIKRDRVPFVLTPDMAYVINNGVSDTPNFQIFIEYCCNAFNILRRNMKLILNLLGLMVYSGISYLSHKDDLQYIREALQIHLTEDEATMYFTRLIESSLSSRSTQLNFFIHNVAHMKNVTETILKSSNSSPLFSFSNKVHSYEDDGFIDTAHVVDFQKRYVPEKHYVFVLNIIRKESMSPKFVFRRYEDFQELHAKLSYLFNVFSGTTLPDLPAKVIFGRSQVREVAIRRRYELDHYLSELSELPGIWRSEIVYTFLHSYIKDIEQERSFADNLEILQDGCKTRIGGRIKLSMVYKKNAFHILVMHVSKLLPRRLQGLADPYVKLYLLPDPVKYTKRKTKTLHKTLNPTFNETMTFDVAMELLHRRILQISVWDHDTLNENIFLGGINFYLSTFDLTKPKTEWFELEDIGLGKKKTT